MASYSWASALSDNWNVATDWSPNGVPGSAGGDTATISATGAAYTVTFNTHAETLNDLTIDSADATLALLSRTKLTVNGTTALQAGTIDLTNSGAILSAGNLIESAAGTIDIGSGGYATFNSASVAGLVDLSGFTTFGTSSSSIILDGLVEATARFATVGFAGISGSGTLEANAAKLDVTGSLANASVVAVISDSSASVFETTGALYYGSSVTLDFLGPLGEFEYNNSSNDTNVIFNAAGLNAGTAQTTPTNFIDLAGTVVVVQSGGTGTGTTGSVVLTNGDTLSLTGITNVGTGGWQAVAQNDGSGGTEVFLTSVCYAAGTRILTPAGEQPVETLNLGDCVITLTGQDRVPQPVQWIGHRRISLTAHPRPETVAPIHISRGAFAENVPHSDLWVSPDHAILAGGTLICARQLVNGTTIRQDLGRPFVDYFHVELIAHAILLAEGLPAESYLDTGNRGFFANASDPLVLHPDLTSGADDQTREARSCHPFVWDEASVRPVWQRLAERAAMLGRPPQVPATTADPAPHLRVAGRTLRPLLSDPNRHVFAIPAATREVRLLSRAGLPTETRPWLEDRRRLGLYVERIVLKATADGTALEIPLDHPALSQGWWSVERDGAALRRWTTGGATLTLPSFDGPAILEITAGPAGMTYVIGHPARAAA